MPEFLWEDLVPGGNHWSNFVRRGTQMRFEAQGENANVSLSLLNRELLSERLNIPDVLKAQHTAFLTVGNVLYSDMGRAMASLVEDSVGWHDALCGPSDDADIEARYGHKSFAQARNAMLRSGREGLLLELGKYGLGKRDLGLTVNLFSKVSVENGGTLQFHPNNAKTGDFVVLRFEMDCLLALSTAPHRLDPKADYTPGDVKISLERAQPVAADDRCRTSCPQNERAFENTRRFLAR